MFSFSFLGFIYVIYHETALRRHTHTPRHRYEHLLVGWIMDQDYGRRQEQQGKRGKDDDGHQHPTAASNWHGEDREGATTKKKESHDDDKNNGTGRHRNR
jgi:hypothetical protein